MDNLIVIFDDTVVKIERPGDYWLHSLAYNEKEG